MNNLTDQQLLRDYTGLRSEAAFVELVRRHVDFVYSAALRMVRDPHLAEDVAQGVFVALAQNAQQLTSRPVLSGWLHRTTQNLAANVVRSDVRRRAREQAAAVMNELHEPDTLWEQVAPHLDTALGELSEADRDALLLRYFQRKSAREMAQTLGTSEDAAQKRVSRAVERLREFLAKRGVTVGASGLVVVISANAVQSAPAGLAFTISTAAALAGTTLATTATATVSNTIAMTTLQKALIGATLAAVVGAGMYEARQASHLRGQVQLLRQQQAPLAERIQHFQQERDDATNRLARLAEENATLKNNSTELMKLRGEVGALRRQNQELAQAHVSTTKDSDAQTLRKGFGTLGEFLAMEAVSDLGNSTAEALVQTFLWAMREGKVERLVQLGAPLGGGDVAGEISESQAAVFRTLQNMFTNSAGFHLSSRPANDGQEYLLRLDAEPLQNSPDDRFIKSIKNFNISFTLEQKTGGWSFGNPSEETSSKSK